MAWRQQANSPHAKCVVLPNAPDHEHAIRGRRASRPSRSATNDHDLTDTARRTPRRRRLPGRRRRPGRAADRHPARPGGPAGSVVERWPPRYPLPRACTIDHEALRILQAAGSWPTTPTCSSPPGRARRVRVPQRRRRAPAGHRLEPDRRVRVGEHQRLPPARPRSRPRRPGGRDAGVSVHRGWTLQLLDPGRTRARWTPRDEHRGRSRSRSPCARLADRRRRANSPVRPTSASTSGTPGSKPTGWWWTTSRWSRRSGSAFVTQYCDPAQPATAVNSGPGRRRFEFMRRADMTVEELGQEAPPGGSWRRGA